MKIDLNKVFTLWRCPGCGREQWIDLGLLTTIILPICNICDEDLSVREAFIPDEYLNN